VIVDEYQDVNPIQEALVNQLHTLGASVRVVGDDDQTIYQWRGSDAANILSFCDRYPKVTTLKLEENFRSTEGITEVARIVVERKKILKEAIDEADITRIKMAEEDDEVRFSVYNIQRQFIGFLERLALREEDVPDGHGEVVFYNLAKFSQAISDFETIYFHSKPVQKYESFAGFLEHQAESAYGEAAGAEERLVSPDAVQILTIHRAKGLQWPVVFVPQLVKNRFPARKPGGRTPWHVIPPESVEGQHRFLGSIEDERRLFYVAVTRSQKAEELTEAQLHIYALGYRELTGKDADFVETYELDTQKRKPRAVDEDLIAEVKKRVNSTAKALRANEFPAKPNENKCSRCDFRKMCSSSASLK